MWARMKAARGNIEAAVLEGTLVSNISDQKFFDVISDVVTSIGWNIVKKKV